MIYNLIVALDFSGFLSWRRGSPICPGVWASRASGITLNQFIRRFFLGGGDDYSAKGEKKLVIRGEIRRIYTMLMSFVILSALEFLSAI